MTLQNLEPASRVRVGLVAGFLGTVLLLHSAWFLGLLESPSPAEAAERDWVAFQRAAERVVSGQSERVYPREFTGDERPEFADGYFFLYPPFFALPILPLAALDPWQGYLACYLGVAVITVLAILGMLRALAVPRATRPVFLLGAMASAPWTLAVFLGQLSAVLLVAPALAFMGWAGRNRLLTGAALSVLVSKPNWGLPVLVLLAVGRRWRMTLGFVLGAVGLVAVSLPLGLGLWSDWFRTMVNYLDIVTVGVPPWKQITLYASIQSLTGLPGSNLWVQGTSAVISALLMGILFWLWFRAGKAQEPFPRLLAVTFLAIVVTNSYVYFYDGVLLVPAAIFLWTKPGAYSGSGLRTASRLTFVFLWFWMYIQFFVTGEAGPSLAGVGLTVWLALELLDLSRWAPASPVRETTLPRGLSQNRPSPFPGPNPGSRFSIE